MQPPIQKITPGQTLEQLKLELGKLTSYTQEIGKASQAAGAVGAVVGKVERLADDALRVMQESAQAAANDFTNKVKQQSGALEEIVKRQQQLADELASFRDALQQAARFAEALDSLAQRFEDLQRTVEAQNQKQQDTLLDLQKSVASSHGEVRIWQWLTLLGVIGTIVSVWLKG